MTRSSSSTHTSHSPFDWRFHDLSRKLESDWLETLDSTALRSKGITKTLIKRHTGAARHRAFQQLVSALLLEEMWRESRKDR